MSNNATSKDDIGRVTVAVEHFYAKPAQQVFDAWLDPARAGRFLFATPDGTMIKAQIDARVGGKFVFIDRREGGDFEHVGQYMIIDRPNRLVFSFCVPKLSEEETTVTLDFTDTQDGCRTHLVHTGVFADYEARVKEGWASILAAVQKVL